MPPCTRFLPPSPIELKVRSWNAVEGIPLKTRKNRRTQREISTHQQNSPSCMSNSLSSPYGSVAPLSDLSLQLGSCHVRGITSSSPVLVPDRRHYGQLLPSRPHSWKATLIKAKVQCPIPRSISTAYKCLVLVFEDRVDGAWFDGLCKVINFQILQNKLPVSNYIFSYCSLILIPWQHLPCQL